MSIAVENRRRPHRDESRKVISYCCRAATASDFLGACRCRNDLNYCVESIFLTTKIFTAAAPLLLPTFQRSAATTPDFLKICRNRRGGRGATASPWIYLLITILSMDIEKRISQLNLLNTFFCMCSDFIHNSFVLYN